MMGSWSTGATPCSRFSRGTRGSAAPELAIVAVAGPAGRAHQGARLRQVVNPVAQLDQIRSDRVFEILSWINAAFTASAVIGLAGATAARISVAVLGLWLPRAYTH